jgi:hypothetical protein
LQTFQEIFTFFLAWKINGDKMSAFNAVGLVVFFVGILVHVINKAISPESIDGDSRDDDDLYSKDSIHMPLLDVGRGVLLVEDAFGQEDLITTDDDEEDVLFNIVNRREVS